MASTAIRYAEPGDAEAIGRVHVHTGQAAYRGLLPDDYLDAQDPGEQAARWSDTLSAPEPGGGQTVLLLEIGDELAGIASIERARDEPSAETGELGMLNI